MPDTNMNTAYSWALGLADLSHLKMTLDINQRIRLILEIETEVGCYISNMIFGSGLFENFSDTVKEIFLNRIDNLVRHCIPHETNEKYEKALDYDCGPAAFLQQKR